MPIPRELQLTDDELDELMTSSWIIRIATIGPGGRINVTPMWFGWAGGNIYFYGRGQKIANLRRDPTVSALVDRNERFPELEGAMFQGRGHVLEDAAAEDDDAHLETARLQMGPKYATGHSDEPDPETARRNPASARGRSWRWVRVEPLRLVTWDNHKLWSR